MAINWISGFRRIGWVLTLPLAALIVLAFYRDTKQFSAAGYEVQQEAVKAKEEWREWQLEPPAPGVVPLESANAYFLPDVPKDVVKEIVNDFVLKDPRDPSLVKTYLDEKGRPMRSHLTFTVYRQVNKFKLSGLIAGSIVISALFIQGSISVLAWIVRGFHTPSGDKG
jgi:hypothetical protein